MSTIETTEDLRNRLASLVASGKTLREIADDLDMSKAELGDAFALAGISMPSEPPRMMADRSWALDVPTLYRLWHETDLSQAAISRQLGVSESAVKRAVRRHGLARRPQHAAGVAADEADVPADEAAASYDSLRLAPSVERAADEVRSRWTPEEEYLRRVTRRQPLTYGHEVFR